MSSVGAIIPAAGFSSRMGRFKPLLPLGDGTVLSACIDAFQAHSINRIVVVTGRRSDDVAEVAENSGAVAVCNENYEQGMFSSIQTGVRTLENGISAFFVLPVDIPLVRSETIGRLREWFRELQPSVLYPRFNGERGHPPVISHELVPAILAHDGNGGLRRVLDSFEAGAADLDVADFGTVHDLDYPADYDLAVARVGNRFPCDEECRQLWGMYNVPSNVIDHCRAVARVAEALCGRLNCHDGGTTLNSALVWSAALTHDIGKGTKRHEAAGAERLSAHGFHSAAAIAGHHFDMTLGPEEPFTEKAVVFLADKLVRGDSPSRLEERYKEKLRLYGHDPEVEAAILGRLGRARNMLDRFDREMGISAEILAREALA